MPSAGRHCGVAATRLCIQGDLCNDHRPADGAEPFTATGPALRPPAPGPDEADIELARRGKLRSRPAGFPACPERALQEQCPAKGLRARTCVRCGRITVRLDGDAVAWCGGILPAGHESRPVRHLAVVR